jgi:hypothetical protein
MSTIAVMVGVCVAFVLFLTCLAGSPNGRVVDTYPRAPTGNTKIIMTGWLMKRPVIMVEWTYVEWDTNSGDADEVLRWVPMEESERLLRIASGAALQ